MRRHLKQLFKHLKGYTKRDSYRPGRGLPHTSVRNLYRRVSAVRLASAQTKNEDPQRRALHDRTAEAASLIKSVEPQSLAKMDQLRGMVSSGPSLAGRSCLTS